MDKISHDKAPRYRRLLTPDCVDMLCHSAQRAKFSPPFVRPGWKAIDYRRCTTGMTEARVSNAAVIDSRACLRRPLVPVTAEGDSRCFGATSGTRSAAFA